MGLLILFGIVPIQSRQGSGIRFGIITSVFVSDHKKNTRRAPEKGQWHSSKPARSDHRQTRRNPLPTPQNQHHYLPLRRVLAALHKLHDDGIVASESGRQLRPFRLTFFCIRLAVLSPSTNNSTTIRFCTAPPKPDPPTWAQHDLRRDARGLCARYLI